MKKEIQYFSTDKMYTLNDKNKKIPITKLIFYVILLISIIVFSMGIIELIKTFTGSRKDNVVAYSENGKADYTVYLKENSYYNTKYLNSGMQYVASLINTINADFKYELHSDKNINFDYKYKIIGTLQIFNKTDPSKVLYTKDNVLLDEVKNSSASNNLVINENVNIDYEEYNNYVNSYKREYGLTVDSRLIITMNIDVDGEYSDDVEKIDKSNKLQITVPLSEQTLDITIDTANIDNSSNLSSKNGSRIDFSKMLLGVVLVFISGIGFIGSKKIYEKYKIGNIYTITLNKILKDYDQLIVNGTVSIKEDKYTNIVYPESFEEMVDASINLQIPILYYDVIPGEKSFFIMTNNDTLYKFRLTKAYLEKEMYRQNSHHSEPPVNSDNQNEEEII